MEHKTKVFILEDNEDDFILLKEILETSDGMDVDIFYSNRLEQAIKKMKNNPVDVAIVDLNLPECMDKLYGVQHWYMEMKKDKK